MIVCFILDAHWSAHSGGAEVQVRYLIDELRRSDDVQIHYICRRYDPTHDNQGIRVHVLPFVPLLSRYLRMIDLPAVWFLLRSIRPSAIYTRVDYPYVMAAAAYAKRYGARSVWHIAHRRDVEVAALSSPRAVGRYVDRKIFEHGVRKTDTIIAQAEYQADLLLENYGLRCDAVIPNFHPPTTEPIDKTGPFRILWIGEIKASKRPELFVELVDRCHEKCDAEFLMIGKCDHPPIKERITELEKAVPKFRYLGELTLEEVNQALASAHLLISTSDSEGMPNTFIQAWLRKVPVVTLNFDPDGVVLREDLGWVHEDPADVARSLPTIVEDRSLIERMGERCMRFAKERYSMDNATRLTRYIVAPQGERQLDRT